MAEHGLDKAQFGAVVQHVGGQGVPEQMAGAGFVNPRLLQPAPDPFGELVGFEGLAQAVAWIGIKRSFLPLPCRIISVCCSSSIGAIIGRYERWEMTPSVEVAKKLADALEVTLDYLVANKALPKALQEKR